MGITLNKLFKRQQANKEKELENRSKEFHIEYQRLVEKFGCDFAPYLMFTNDEKAVVANLRIIDVKEDVEKRKEEEAKKSD